MKTVLLEQSVLSVHARRAADNDLWLAVRDAETATGWTLKPEGFCKGDICVPVPPARAGTFFGDDEINVAALWRHIGLPYARDASGETWALGASAAERSNQLQSLQAPDFSLPDLQGDIHSLSEQCGRKVLLVSWASWRGCRSDLPVWQKLFAELAGKNFTVIAVAFDELAAARPWI